MLQITLSNIREKIVGAPTVLWTGNGYHIYQPIDIPQRFEDMEDFGEFDNLDNLFLDLKKICCPMVMQIRKTIRL